MNHRTPIQGGASEAPGRDALALIIECLAARGWMTDCVVKNAATKDFATAVGPKQATIWVAYSYSSACHVLTGQYESQRNNALSACWTWIPATAHASEIANAVDEHLAKVEHAIGETFAVKLLKHHPPQAGT